MKLFLTVTMLVALAAGGPALAQPKCDVHARIIAFLDMKYGEVRLGVGKSVSNLFEMWASAETGTWHILEVFSSGTTCVRASGDGWTVDPPVASGSPV